MMLCLAETRSGGGVRAVVVIGLGLVGSALAAALRQRMSVSSELLLPLQWLDEATLRGDIQSAEGRLLALLPDGTGETCLKIAYCAGTAGFAATTAQTAAEFHTFQSVLRMAERIGERRPGIGLVMHMLSSAGGLFEGQVRVTGATQPSPRRAYGHLKLSQEQELWAASARLRKHAHRLTSVYGPIHGQQRRGLVATLIQNGIRHHLTQIVGRSTTLRDFVWVEDVASFLADTMLCDREALLPRATVLASGKPSSIMEIVRIVERVIRKPVYVNFPKNQTNSLDTTFAPDLCPQGWVPSDLQTNISRIYLNCLAFQTDHAASPLCRPRND